MTARFNIRRNVTVSMLAFGVNLTLVFVSYRLILTTGGLETLGLWSSLMAWIFVIRLGDVGMATAAVRFVALCDARTGGDQIRRYLDTALPLNALLFACLSVLGFILYSLALDYIVVGSNDMRSTARTILPLMFAGFFLSNISGSVLGGLVGLHRGYQSALVGVLGTVIQMATVVWLVPQLGLGGLAWGLIAQHLVMLVMGWVMILFAMRRETGFFGALLPLNISKHALREMMGFSVKTQFFNLINGLLEPLSKILIGRLAGLEMLGLYEMAFKIVALPRNAVTSGVQVLVPSLSRLLLEDRAAARYLTRLSERRLIQGSVALAVALVATLPGISWLWLEQVNTHLWIFTALLALGFLGNSVGATAYVLALAAGKTDILLLSSTGALALTAGLVPLAEMIFGEIDAVAGVAIALTGGGVFAKILSRRILE